MYGQVAYCCHCEAIILRAERLSMDGWLAFTFASAILFVLANAFPVISIGVQNFHSDVTLWEATTSLARGGWASLAAPASVMTILIPFVQMGALGWILVFAWRKERPPGFRSLMKILAVIRPWSMAEVAFLAVMVACIKLSSMAQVSLDAGSWCMLASTSLAACTSKRDIHWLWNAVMAPQSNDGASSS
jgi:paraquat-inducible protein A